MDYFLVRPEIAGDLGPETRMTHEEHPPTVHELHYMFLNLPEDDLMESFPTYIVSEDLATALESSALTGFEFADVHVSKDLGLAERMPDRELGAFRWLQLTGDPGRDDFGSTEKASLVVSADAPDLLEAFSLEYTEFEPYEES